jgi:hypothetical protein
LKIDPELKVQNPELSNRKYTFNVNCSFEVQFSFAASEVEQDPEGAEGDLCPTESALQALSDELRQTLGENYVVDKVEAVADFDDLMGISDT